MGGHRSPTDAAYHPAVATDAPSRDLVSRVGGLAGLTPSGRAIVPLAWALYDFANTIFSYAVVSVSIGLWLTDPSRFGRAEGHSNQMVHIGCVVLVAYWYAGPEETQLVGIADAKGTGVVAQCKDRGAGGHEEQKFVSWSCGNFHKVLPPKTAILVPKPRNPH